MRNMNCSNCCLNGLLHAYPLSVLSSSSPTRIFSTNRSKEDRSIPNEDLWWHWRLPACLLADSCMPNRPQSVQIQYSTTLVLQIFIYVSRCIYIHTEWWRHDMKWYEWYEPWQERIVTSIYAPVLSCPVLSVIHPPWPRCPDTQMQSQTCCTIDH